MEFKEYPIPEPGHGQVLVRMKASSICGSDIRAIYREHLGKGPEGYQGVIAGHEPCGQIVKVGPGCKRFRAGDRVVIYHISGCGVCDECQHGYMISCRSEFRAAYGWQRDGGHAPYLLAEENTCIRLPDSLSYIDGGLCACGFGTAYEALRRMQVSGQDRLLITGTGAGGPGRGDARPRARGDDDHRHRPLGASGWRWRATWAWSTPPSRPTTAPSARSSSGPAGHGCEVEHRLLGRRAGPAAGPPGHARLGPLRLRGRGGDGELRGLEST